MKVQLGPKARAESAAEGALEKILADSPIEMAQNA